MSIPKWLLISGTFVLLVALVAVAVAWSAPQGQTPVPSTSYVPSPNLPDSLSSGLSAKKYVFNATVYTLRGISSQEFEGCVAWVQPTGRTGTVWVISPEHRIQTAIGLAAIKNKQVRVCGRKYNQPPDVMDWQGMDVYLADKVIVTLKSL